jgi:hypothetical protein
MLEEGRVDKVPVVISINNNVNRKSIVAIEPQSP